MYKNIIISSAILAALSIQTTMAATASTSSAAPGPAAPTGSPVTDPAGDAYLASVQAAIKGFTHRDTLSGYTKAAAVPTTAGLDQAAVCLQKTEAGIFRSHSVNPSARGIVTSQPDLDALGPLFGQNQQGKFILNVPQNLDGTGNIISYIGQVFLKDGDGTANGDVLCFARYLQNQSASSSAPAQKTAASPATQSAAASPATPNSASPAPTQGAAAPSSTPPSAASGSSSSKSSGS